METRSIFSVNTNQTGFKGTVIPNSNSQAI